MKYLLTLAVAVLFSCTSSGIRNAKPAHDLESKKVIQHLLDSKKYMMYDTDFLKAIHYAEVCTAYGALGYLQETHDDELLKMIMDRYAPLKNDSIAWQDHHVDGNVYGILPLRLFQMTQDSNLLRQGLYLADKQWENPLPSGMSNQTRYWIDDVFMVGALQIEAFKATKEKNTSIGQLALPQIT